MVPASRKPSRNTVAATTPDSSGLGRSRWVPAASRIPLATTTAATTGRLVRASRGSGRNRLRATGSDGRLVARGRLDDRAGDVLRAEALVEQDRLPLALRDELLGQPEHLDRYVDARVGERERERRAG